MVTRRRCRRCRAHDDPRRCGCGSVIWRKILSAILLLPPLRGPARRRVRSIMAVVQSRASVSEPRRISPTAQLTTSAVELRSVRFAPGAGRGITAINGNSAGGANRPPTAMTLDSIIGVPSLIPAVAQAIEQRPRLGDASGCRWVGAFIFQQDARKRAAADGSGRVGGALITLIR